MKTRTALLLAGLILLTGSVFAADERNPRGLLRDIGEGAPVEQASRVIKVPYYLDGVLFPAGHPLPDYSVSVVVGLDDLGAQVVNVFSSKDVATEFKRQQQAKVVEAGRWGAKTNSCTWTQTYSWFNTAVGCGNPGVLTLSYPNSYDDLDFGGWNNSISCVKAACNGYYTVIYSCRDFATENGPGCDEADDYAIAEGVIITDLNTIGFNNRTSSIQFQ